MPLMWYKPKGHYSNFTKPRNYVMSYLIGTRPPILSLRNTKQNSQLPVWGSLSNCFLTETRGLLGSRATLFGFLFSVSSRELCRVQKDSLCSSFLHKNWLWRFAPRSLNEINREFTAHNLRPRHTVGLGEGSMPKITDCPDKSQSIAKLISCLYSSCKAFWQPHIRGAKNNGERGALSTIWNN